jgi:hypothetical protein
VNWIKKGLVFNAPGDSWWARTHAIAPTPYLLGSGDLRIYVGICDEGTTSRIGFVDVDAAEPERVLRVSAEPVLDIGEPGAFDDSGVVPTCVVRTDDALRLYYVGFQRGVQVPYCIFSGLAVSTDGGESFERCGRAPILDRTDDEPLWRTAPFVLAEDGAWRLWYSGGGSWAEVDGKPMPILGMRSAESNDGLTWTPNPEPCFDVNDEDEFAFSRPFVLRNPAGYRMFYAIRGRKRSYRLGYAESQDGIRWERRDDQLGLALSDSGWDSEMLYAPSVVELERRSYLFYNGNGTGATGFGYAELEAT